MMSNDIRSTLTISGQEAANGTVRTISLPNGQQIPISVPAGAFEGQVLQFPLPGQTELLTLTIHVLDAQGNPPSGDRAFVAGSSPALIPFETRTTPSGPNVPGYVPEVPPPPPSDANWQQAQAPGSNVPPPPQNSGPNWQQAQTSNPNWQQAQTSNPNWQQAQTSNPNWQQAQTSGVNIPPPPPQVSGPNWQQQYPVAPPPDPLSGPNAYATTPQVGQPFYPPVPTRKGGIGTRAIVLIVLAVVIIVGASALIFVNYNAQQTAHINATATAQTATSVVNATSTSQTSQVNGTQTAQAEATNAAVQATNTVQQSNPNPYGGNGSLAVYDKLDGNSGNTWTSNSACLFTDGSYHERSTKVGYVYFCTLTGTPDNVTSFGDLALEVKMSITKGDVGGVIFHTDGNYGYVLTIDTHGFSRLTLYPAGSTQSKTLWEGRTSALKQGYGQVNTVGIVTQGSNISWYINSQRINSVSNSTFTTGGVGMIGGLYSNSTNKSNDVTFSSLRVWKL